MLRNKSIESINHECHTVAVLTLDLGYISNRNLEPINAET